MINHKEIDPYNEEVWEENVIVKKDNDTIILENVEIKGNFNYNYQRCGQISDSSCTITFNNVNEKNNFIGNYNNDFRKKLHSVRINKYDKNGLLIETFDLFGVIILRYYNLNVALMYDYWRKTSI